ncbi:MAG: family 10 glycosylhydrolase [Candidatus Marinimicrobia bacterium]|nr:family 10 glycosylhydrolase [Candidatus Neomarinimicrobiota bacterium]
MKYIIRIICISIFIAGCFAGQTQSPKHEFRGVWLSTVANIDWPEDKHDSEAKKQADLMNYMDTLQAAGINAIVFQVRPACDAMYQSPLEPWSYWFSGTQGEGPPADSLWDPLEFAVTEAHRRGMELHAWVNPYRAVKDPEMADSVYFISDQHISKQHPDWILQFKSVHILDPGKTKVREYITKVFMDIVNRYDIDGLHMDDYFYPYSGIDNEDSLTFVEENRSIDSIDDWRRDNINLLVQAVSDSINIVKPWVKWGISPFGIYRPNIPEGIEGFDAWAILYCDPIAWLKAGSVDYITPQCYWPFDGGQDYGTLIPYWAKIAKKYHRHFYPGQALYRAASDKFPNGEIPRQIRLNRDMDGCDGSVFFTANNFYSNPANTIDSMKQDLYILPALWPVLPHQKGRPLSPPIVFSERNDDTVTLFWEPTPEAWGYVVYRSRTQSELVKQPGSIAAVITDQNGTFYDKTDEQWFYAVTALNNYKLESRAGHAINDFVVPCRPAYASEEKRCMITFKWEAYRGAEDYHIQVSTDKHFDFIVYEERLLSATRLVKKLNRGYTYYWRIKANNNDVWSPTWTFIR